MRGFGRPGERTWESPEATGWNRLPARSPLVPFPDAEAARRGPREASPWLLSLVGPWRFRLFERPEDVPEDAAAPERDDAGQAEVEVPGNWTLQGWDRPHYTNVRMPFEGAPPRVPEANPTGVYRRRFRLPESFAGRRVVLHFGGAESVLYVWVNGTPVGFSKDSRLAAEFDVTDHVRPGENLVAAAVVRWSDASFLEDQDHWWMAGLHREVLLLATGAPGMEDVHLDADFDPSSGEGHLRVRCHLGALDRPVPDDWRVEVRVLDPRGRSALREPLRGGVAHRGNPYAYRGEVVELAATLPRVRPWSAETPDLYTVLVSLRDGEGREREAVSLRAGFRRVEVRDRALLVNGRAVLVKGVNRHDHDDARGKAVAREAMREDVLAMKRFHLNAVRTAHYPNDPYFLECCDELGLYVVDEANAESHAWLRSLCDDPRYTRAFFERAERMVRRDKSHPSVIAWSLGNESGYGSVHAAMAGWIRRYDGTRPIHYEGALEFRLEPDRLATDLICPMYASVDRIVRWARTTRDDRPLILCEYSHAMGNSNGSLREYFEAFERHRGLQGGFVWDWMDQGLRRTDARGRTFWAYGGDFGDEPNDENFNINGLVWPDRTPHPGVFELAKLAQPVGVEAGDLRRGRIRVRNKQDFTDTAWLRGRFRVEVDGRVVQRGRLPRLRVPPGGTAAVTLPLRTPRLGEGEEAFLTVAFDAAHDRPWAPAGSLVAWEQLPLPEPSRRRPRARPLGRARRADDARALAVAEVGGTVEAAAGSVAFAFERATGTLVALSRDGRPLLHEPPRLCLWRAPTDNDARSIEHLRRPGFVRWVDLGLDGIVLEKAEARFRRRRDGALVVRSRRRHRVPAAGAEVNHVETATLGADGTLLLEHVVRLDRGLSEVPRLGLVLSLAPGFETLRWLGRGPHESYADRKAGAGVGLFSGSVAEQHVPYIRPQANGNKTDVRWLALERESEAGVCVAGRALLEFTASHLRDEDLAAARHTNELEPRPETVLHVDARQRGVGTGSCGPDTLPAYRIGPGVHRFAFALAAYAPGRGEPGRLGRALGAAAAAPESRSRPRRVARRAR